MSAVEPIYSEPLVLAFMENPQEVAEAYRRLNLPVGVPERRGGLTGRQLEAFRFIERSITERGVAPTYVEISDALGLASKSGAHRLICLLEERGFVRRLPDRGRSLEIIARAA